MNEHDLHQWRVALAQLGERVAQLDDDARLARLAIAKIDERVAQLEEHLGPVAPVEVAGVPFVDHLGVEDVEHVAPFGRRSGDAKE